MNQDFLDPEQAAAMLGLSAYTVRAYARQGVIPAHKIGRTWRFSRADLEDWVLSSGGRPSSSYGLLARESGALSADEHPACAPGGTVQSESREAAVETLRAIRARALGKVDVAGLIRRSREELLSRGQDDDRLLK